MDDNSLQQAAPSQISREMENMYLNFYLGEELYGIEIRYTSQIFGMREITKMPEMPPYMKGIMVLRDQVVPVISMRLRLGKEEIDYTDRTCIVMVHSNGRDMGLIVDSIKEVIIIDPENISSAPVVKENADSGYIQGIARLPGDIIAILLNTPTLFDDKIPELNTNTNG